MLYIFKNSIGGYIEVTEREAREIIDGVTGGRIKYDYLGAIEDSEFRIARLKVISEAKELFGTIDRRDDEKILQYRNHIDSKLIEEKERMYQNIDNSKTPRSFRVFKLSNSKEGGLDGNGRVENQEETNPIFRGMIHG